MATGDALYVQKLNKEATEHNPPKTARYSGIDPSNQMKWTEYLNQVAQVTLPDVFVYLVCGESVYNDEQFKNDKSVLVITG